MPEDHFLVTFYDLVRICKQARGKVLFATFICALIASSYALTRPTLYVAEASFKEKATKEAGIDEQSLSSMLLGKTPPQSTQTISFIRSRKFLGHLAKTHNLQASLTANTSSNKLLKRIHHNLLTEYAYLTKQKTPIFPDIQPTLHVENVHYSGEFPLSLEIKFISKDQFKIVSSSGNIGTGMLGFPFNYDNFSFTLVGDSDTHASAYTLSLSPLSFITQQIEKQISIKNSRYDNTLLELTFVDTNRQNAAFLLNSLMEHYQKHLKEEHQRIAEEQISYLKKRQEEIGADFKLMMEVYAAGLSSELSTAGFPDSGKAMNFLATGLEKYKEKLLATDLEIKRLNQAQRGSIAYYERYNSLQPSIINILLAEIRDLKQQRDSIDIALRQEDTEFSEEALTEQMTQLRTIQDASSEAKELLADLNLPPKVLVTSQYAVKAWQKKLEEAKNNWKKASPKEQEVCKNEWERCESNFKTYLSNLIHLLHVHENTIQERLAHQHNPQGTFQGISLEVAEKLYVDYSEQLNEVEAQALEHQFILKEMEDPEFEISSLGAILNDPASRTIVDNAASIALQLNDQDNRSEREQTRLKGEQNLQKKVLEMHVEQITQLLHLREDLFKSKINALQKASLELIQQKISILEKQLSDYITTRLDNLKQENLVIEHHQQELQKEIAKLPQKWASEKLIDQQLQINQKMVEEVTRLVESKNIASNLEIVQSAPLDIAIPPTLPKQPGLFLFMAFGGFLGGFLTLAFVLLQSVIRGVIATEENLRASRQHVSGTLSSKYCDTFSKPPIDTDLTTLRRLVAFLEVGKSLLIVKGKGPDYSHNLASLLAKKDLKVLILSLSFDHTSEPGLLQYLEGENKEPDVQHNRDFDEIAAGGICRFSNELLGSARFKDLIEKYKTQYDCVIATTATSPTSAEAENLASIFDQIVVSVNKDTLQELGTYMQHPKASFVVIETPEY